MKKTITGVAAVAILTCGMVSTSHAWFVKAKNEMNRAGRDVNSKSHNRTNSHDIKGDVKNSIVTGNGGFRLTNQNVSQSVGNISVGTAGKKGSVGGVTVGDGNNFGHNSGGNQQNFHLGDANVDARDMRQNYKEDNRVDNRK